jgi:hypothetical protein
MLHKASFTLTLKKIFLIIKTTFMNKIICALLLLPLFFTANCQTLKRKKPKKNVVPVFEYSSKVLKGFNQNFSMMPNMTEAMYKNIQALQPQVLRYPGGTVTHSWDWRKGIIEKRASNKTHPIAEIKTLIEYTKADFVFVLDIANKSLEDQIEMLTAIEKLGVAIKYIELGNELYANEDNYKEVFPTGKDYANRVNQWVPTLKQKFPKAKIAALLSGRKVKETNKRLYNWNRQVVDNTINTIDAFTYHIYINEKETFENEKAEFLEVTSSAKTNNKELWITEYGNKQDKTKPSYYTELSALANFVESFPNVTLSLNHQIVGGTKAKLTEDGNDFVEEGLLYLKRIKK